MKAPKEPIKNFTVPIPPDRFIFHSKMITVSDDLYGSVAEIPLSRILDKLSLIQGIDKENISIHIESSVDYDEISQIDGIYLKYKIEDPDYDKKYSLYLKQLEKYNKKQAEHEEKYVKYRKELEEYNKIKTHSELELLEKQKLLIEKKIKKLKNK